MRSRSTGRPRAFDREVALRSAAHLFWRHGYSGTSTRMLTAELGVANSSLYAAFGTKAELFGEAVRSYASRYSAIYERAVAEPTLAGAVEQLLVASVHEFTRVNEGHPGCMISSAVMADAPETLDVRAYVEDLQQRDEARLRLRIERAAIDGDIVNGTDPTALAGLVQTMWHGLSVRAELGEPRENLVAAARLGAAVVAGPVL